MKNKVLKGILLTMFLASLYVAPHVGESEVENKATVEALSTTNKVIYTTKLLTSSSIEIASCESIKPTLEVIDNLIVMSPLESDLQNENQNNNENIEETVVEESEEPEIYSGWITTKVNVRKEPNTSSEILDTFGFNTHIEYTDYDDYWAEIVYNDTNAFISKDYISNEEFIYQSYSVPNYSGFKSWMPYNCFNKSSSQYKLQQMAYTGSYGIRYVGERACVAIGTFAGTSIGQYIDIVLENGTIIPAIMADEKANKDTEANNMITKHSNCCTEFIVDTKHLSSVAKKIGDMSYCRDEWNSKVVEIRIYQENILN